MCLILFSFLLSCSSGDDIPKDIIPLRQMKFIVYDVLQAEELAPLMYPKDTVAAKLKTTGLFQQVFAIYKISREDFYKSFHYYEAHPDMNQILFDSLSQYANRKRQEHYQKMK